MNNEEIKKEVLKRMNFVDDDKDSPHILAIEETIEVIRKLLEKKK